MKSTMKNLLLTLQLCTLALSREVCVSTSKSCVPGESYCASGLFACVSCRACCDRLITNLQLYHTAEEGETCFESCGCEESSPFPQSEVPCGATNPNGCKSGYFCTSSDTCDPCISGMFLHLSSNHSKPTYNKRLTQIYARKLRAARRIRVGALAVCC